MTKEKTLQIYKDRLNEGFCKIDNVEPMKFWVVLVDGERVAMRNRKCVWKQKNHASAALTNHFDSAYGNPVWELRKYGLSYREARNKLKEIRDQWKKDHVEIITLDEWIERRKHD